MAEMPQGLRELISKVAVCYLATASPDGIPDVAPLMTAIVVDAGTIAVAVKAQGKSATNLRGNPHAALVVHTEPPAGADASLASISQVMGAQIKGTATVHTSGDVYELVRRRTSETLDLEAAEIFDATVVLKVEEVFSLVPGARREASTH